MSRKGMSVVLFFWMSRTWNNADTNSSSYTLVLESTFSVLVSLFRRLKAPRMWKPYLPWLWQIKKWKVNDDNEDVRRFSKAKRKMDVEYCKKNETKQIRIYTIF